MAEIQAERCRAVLYLRCASGRQTDRDLAIVTQQHVCAWRAHELGASVTAEFVDFGSGLTTERPGLSELLAHLRRQQTSRQRLYVIAADHSRIGRSVQAYSHVSWAIEQAGGRLVIASVPQIEYDDLARRMGALDRDLSPPPESNQGDNA